MTSYIEQILQPGERRLYSGKLHWILYSPGVLLLIAALFFFILAWSAERYDGWPRLLWLIVALLCLVGSAYYLFWAWFERWTTEIEVTDRRIVYKEGFIRRTTVEMHMDKVESVDVYQSILGRLLDYGRVIIRGTGEGMQPLHTVAAPLQLRNHITGVAMAEKT